MKAAAWSRIRAAHAPTARAMLFHAVFVAGVTVLKSATNALYLAHRPPAGLALLYVAVAALVAVATALLAGPFSRFPPRSLLRQALWWFAVAIAALAGGYAAGGDAVLGPLYVAGELYATSVSILFWSTVSGWFDARSARRGFGLISAGGMAGAMVGGVATRALVDVLGGAGTAVLAVGVTAAALPLLAGDDARATPRADGQSMRSGASYLARHPFPRLLAVLAIAFSALGACVDYVFRVGAAARLNELELAALFGDLNAIVGAAAIAYQVLLTRYVLERGGLFVFLGVVPVLLAGLGVAAALSGSFALLIVAKGIEMAGSYSILQSGLQLLFNPIPPGSRAAVRAFVDGLVKKAGLALAGLGLVLLAESVPEAVSPWLVTGLAAVCLILMPWLRGGYLGALEEKLRGSRAAVITPTIEVADRATRAVLHRALQSKSGAEVLAALAILERDPLFRPVDHLEGLLTHDDPAVRVAALELVPEQPSPEIESALTTILSLDLRRPRAAAVRAFARSRPNRAKEVLVPYLRDADPGVACAVVAALYPDESARRRLDELLDPALGSAERREVARLLGDLPAHVGCEHLPRFFDDPSESVRTLALTSAAKIFGTVARRGDVEAVMPLVSAVRARLAVRGEREAAREALTEIGDLIVPMLRENLDDRGLPLAVRLEIPRLLGRIGTAAAAEALLFSNIRDDPSLRYRIADALFRLHRTHPDVPIDRERTDEACQRRLRAFTHYRPLCHAVTVHHRGGTRGSVWGMLERTLTERLLQNLDMAVHLLGLHRGAERMDRVARLLAFAERTALGGGSAEEVQALRADALEVLDVALQGDTLRAEILAVLEQPPPAGVDPRWRTVADVIEALRRSADPLVAALARWLLGGAAAAAGERTEFEEVESMDEKLLGRILALEKVDLFTGLPVDDVAAIAGIADEKHSGPGEVLYREGEPGRSMIVILRGRVKLTRGGRAFMELGTGESLGQVSLLDRGPRATTATVGDVPEGADLLVIDCDTFMDLVTDRPELTRGLFAVLAKRLRMLIDLQGGKAEGAR